MVTPCSGALCPGSNTAAHGPACNESAPSGSALNESGEADAAHGTGGLHVCGQNHAGTQADGCHEYEQAHQLVASTKCTCGHESVHGRNLAEGVQGTHGEGAKVESAAGLLVVTTSGALCSGCCGCGLQADALEALPEGRAGDVKGNGGGELGGRERGGGEEGAERGGEKEGKGESEKGKDMGNTASLSLVGKGEKKAGNNGEEGGIAAAGAPLLVAAAPAAAPAAPAAPAANREAAAAAAAAAGVTARVGDGGVESLWQGWDEEGKGSGEGKVGGEDGGEESPREAGQRRDVRWRGRGVGVGASAGVGVGVSVGRRVGRSVGESVGESAGVNIYARATAADFVNRKQIGTGRNAVVYAATCVKTGRKVAVKAYVKSALSALDRHRINREVALLMTLNHEHIIQWLGHFEDTQCVYIVQEWASGGDLFEELRASGGHMPEARIAKHILLPLLAALHHMHAKGIVHRDLKPENLLLTFHGTLKVCDFGLAINMKEERPASRLGTLQYMAPEVVRMARGQRGRVAQGGEGNGEGSKSREKRGGAEEPRGQAGGQGQVTAADAVYDEKVDIWACGVLVYELVMGHPPFEGSSDVHTATNILHRELTHSMLPDAMSAACKDFICRVLRKEPAERPSLLQMLDHPFVSGHCRGRPLFKEVRQVVLEERWRQEREREMGEERRRRVEGQREEERRREWWEEQRRVMVMRRKGVDGGEVANKGVEKEWEGKGEGDGFGKGMAGVTPLTMSPTPSSPSGRFAFPPTPFSPTSPLPPPPLLASIAAPSASTTPASWLLSPAFVAPPASPPLALPTSPPSPTASDSGSSPQAVPVSFPKVTALTGTEQQVKPLPCARGKAQQAWVCAAVAGGGVGGTVAGGATAEVVPGATISGAISAAISGPPSGPVSVLEAHVETVPQSGERKPFSWLHPFQGWTLPVGRHVQ
ncbi:hypothetical protein CLOM_g12163 [Closterium sp. NIES-68]|nr:hypothetical protein CLOM_g12163 [Closterium sp. NIES-68]GJP77320.1 hypothetical protein CLOP_g7732 [Closterium sp. NIES-67]